MKVVESAIFYIPFHVFIISHLPGLMSLPSEGRLRVVIQPKPQSLMVGDHLHLECGAVGRPVPHYQWYRNGVPLKNATKRKFIVRY